MKKFIDVLRDSGYDLSKGAEAFKQPYEYKNSPEELYSKIKMKRKRVFKKKKRLLKRTPHGLKILNK